MRLLKAPPSRDDALAKPRQRATHKRQARRWIRLADEIWQSRASAGQIVT